MYIGVLRLLILAILVALFIGFIAAKLLKSKTSLEIMLLGIGVILVGGIILGGAIALDADVYLIRGGCLFVLIGLSFLIGGFAKKES